MTTDQSVLFADIQPALSDTDRLHWLLPVIAGGLDDPAASARTRALWAGLQRGLIGVPLVDFAMGVSP